MGLESFSGRSGKETMSCWLMLFGFDEQFECCEVGKLERIPRGRGLGSY